MSFYNFSNGRQYLFVEKAVFFFLIIRCFASHECNCYIILIPHNLNFLTVFSLERKTKNVYEYYFGHTLSRYDQFTLWFKLCLPAKLRMLSGLKYSVLPIGLYKRNLQYLQWWQLLKWYHLNFSSFKISLILKFLKMCGTLNDTFKWI